MTDPRKESLSALIDGEASELEVHRLVREFGADGSLKTSWARYQHIRTTVRGDTSASGLDPASHELLFQRISEAVDAEDQHRHEAPAPSQKRVVAGSLALAASLVVAVFVGVQQPATNSPSAAPVTVATTGSAVTPGPVPVQMVSTEAPAPELVELDEERQRQLRAYLQQHDRMSRMNANRQLVNYNNESSGK